MRENVEEELAKLEVFGPTSVGWDSNLPPNEYVDEYGEPIEAGTDFGEPDPRVPSCRDRNHPEVQHLREHLRKNNGIRHLEICSPDEVERATRIFRRDGFVVVRDLLSPNRLADMREACARNLRKILSVPGLYGRRYMQESGRLPHRYCYGTTSASRQMMHEVAWANMIDMPTTTPILKSIFASDDYIVWGGGGDLSLPGAIEYQHLHTDGIDSQENRDARLDHARRLGLDVDSDKRFSDLDFRTQRLVMDLSSPGVTINFMMCDLTWENGPIRQIPGTQTATNPPPIPSEEPEWMRLSTLVGAPAGAGVFRDTRAWHGATPNLSNEIRALPSIEYSAPSRQGRGFLKAMPHEVWEQLSPHAQHVCRHIKQDPGVWPYGAGELFALASARREAYLENSGEVGKVDTVRTDPRSAGTAVRLFNGDKGGY